MNQFANDVVVNVLANVIAATVCVLGSWLIVFFKKKDLLKQTLGGGWYQALLIRMAAWFGYVVKKAHQFA